MKKLALLGALVVLLSVFAQAQTYKSIQGDCEQGGQQVVTDGRSSTTRVQRSFPSCVVTVYQTGTTVLATIYSDSVGTPKSNPFTADSDGHWQWYAANGTYDVKTSGSGLPSPITRAGYWISSGGGGGGGTVGPGTVQRFPIFTASTAIGDSVFAQVGTSEFKAAASGKRINLDTGSQLVVEVANDTGTGTLSNRLAKLTGAPSKAVKATTTDTNHIIGIVGANAGTSGSAQIVQVGVIGCEFDGATVAGDYVIASTTTDGKCHSAGTSLPTNSAQVIGRVLSTNAASGTYDVYVFVGEQGRTSLSGSGTTNYVTLWSSPNTLTTATDFFRDSGTPEYVMQDNLHIYTTDATSRLYFDDSQVVIEGSATRANSAVNFTVKATATQTGPFLKFTDSTGGSTLFQVDADGDIRPRGVNYTWPSALPGSTQCIQVTSGGVMSFTGCSTSLTATYVGFGSATNTLTGSSSLTWDDINKNLTLTAVSAGQFIMSTGSTASAIRMPAGASPAQHPGSGGGLILPFVGSSQSGGPGVWWCGNAYNACARLALDLGLTYQGGGTSTSPFKIRKGSGTSSDGSLIFEFRPDDGLANLYPYGTSAGNTTSINFLELAANGTNKVSLKGPDTLAADISVVLPIDLPGGSDECLQISSAGQISRTGAACGSGGGGGSVTSVGLTMPSGFSVAGSPVTTSGTLAVTTSLSGMIKGTGTGFTVGTPGTDYTTTTSTESFTNKSLTSSTDVLGGVTMTLGSDANGDIYYRSGGVLTRLGIGTSGKILGSNGSVPGWVSSNILLPQATLVSSNYTALTTDWLVSMDATAAARTITLYAASGNTGRIVQGCKRDVTANTVDITDGTTTWTIYTGGQCMQFLSDGTNWQLQTY